MEDLFKEIQEMQKKVAKFENMQGRYVELAKKLKQASELIADVANEIDPLVNYKERQSSGVDFKEIANEVYARMQEGTEITSDLMQKTYGFDAHKANYLCQILKRKPNVDSRKLPGTAMKAYYCRKEFK